MADHKVPPPAYAPQPTAPLNQAQPGYGPGGPYQGYQGGAPGYGPAPGYQGGAPPGYQGGPAPGYQGQPAPGYQQGPATTTNVYVRPGPVGNCPACSVGHTNTEFTILGVCLAILFFPIGILCCLLLTERRCSNCGMTYT